MLVAKIDLVIPALKDKFFDLRDTLPGDSYHWSWERSLSEVKYLALHHSATDATKTPKEIAQYHINHNGWGGIGYHFLIDKDGGVFYVGDISTARANVSNMNEQVIGIGLIGNFTQGVIPTHEQLDSTGKLCQFLMEYPGLKNIKDWDNVKGHKELPKQSTICPGETWQDWKKRLMQAAPEGGSDILKSQVDNLQTSLALLEQQRISLQEALQEREQEIAILKGTSGIESVVEPKIDSTLTITQALINLYKFIFLPRKVEEVV